MKRLTGLAAKSAVALGAILAPLPVYAQVADPKAKEEACKGISGSAECGDPGFFSNLVLTIVNVLTLIVGGVAVIMLVIGGIRYATSGGDPQGTKGAKDSIIYAIIGIVVAASAQLIVRFVIGRI